MFFHHLTLLLLSYSYIRHTDFLLDFKFKEKKTYLMLLFEKHTYECTIQNCIHTQFRVLYPFFFVCLEEWIILVNDYSVCKSQHSIRKSQDYVFVFFFMAKSRCVRVFCVVTSYSLTPIHNGYTVIKYNSISLKPLVCFDLCFWIMLVAVNVCVNDRWNKWTVQFDRLSKTLASILWEQKKEKKYFIRAQNRLHLQFDFRIFCCSPNRLR